MKATIQTKALLEALTLAQKVSVNRSNLPVLSSALLEVEGTTMRVSCDSLDSRISIDVTDVVTDGLFSVLAPVRMLIYSLRGETAELSVEGGKLVVNSGGRSVLGILPVSEFPPAWKSVPRHSVDPVEFLMGLKMGGCCCADGDEPLLGSIHFDPKTSRLVSCDRTTMAAAPATLLMDEPFLLPQTSAKAILTTFSGEEKLDAGVYDGIFAVNSPGKTMWSKLTSGRYPDYAVIIPKSGETIKVNREELIEAARSLSGFVDENQKVAVTPTDGEWRLSASFAGHESAVTIKASGAVVKPFTLKSSQIVRLIQHWNCDTISIMRDTGALLLKPDGQENPIGVISLLRSDV